jgi:hypothetical protein
MGSLLVNCPHCGATNSTFHFLDETKNHRKNGIINQCDSIAYCSHCSRAVLFSLEQISQTFTQPSALTGNLKAYKWQIVEQYPNSPSVESPEHTPTNVASSLTDALKSEAASIWQGAGLLARKAIEMALAERKGGNEIKNLKAAIQEYKGFW